MMTKDNEPQVYIAPVAEQKIRHFVDLARGEVSGLGTVVERDGGLLIEEVFLIEQECTGSHTALDDEAVARLLVQLDGEGADIGSVRCWWHSHGDLQSFWSTTDTACIAGLANDSYLVSLVTNKRSQDRLRIDQFRPFHATFDGLPMRIKVDDLGLRDECEVEFRTKVDEMLMAAPQRIAPTCWPRSLAADPPWPHEDYEDDGWWDGDEWALSDDRQLALQIDDPWGRVMPLGADR